MTSAGDAFHGRHSDVTAVPITAPLGERKIDINSARRKRPVMSFGRGVSRRAAGPIGHRDRYFLAVRSKQPVQSVHDQLGRQVQRVHATSGWRVPRSAPRACARFRRLAHRSPALLVGVLDPNDDVHIYLLKVKI